MSCCRRLETRLWLPPAFAAYRGRARRANAEHLIATLASVEKDAMVARKSEFVFAAKGAGTTALHFVYARVTPGAEPTKSVTIEVRVTE